MSRKGARSLHPCGHVCTCWYALTPFPLKASNHLLLCTLLLLLLQLHHPLHQNLHLHCSVNQLEKIKRENGFKEPTQNLFLTLNQQCEVYRVLYCY